MAGGWAAALRGRAAATEAAVGEPALLLVDVAAALLRGYAAARRTAEGAGTEAFQRAAVAGGGGRIGTGVFRLLRFLESLMLFEWVVLHFPLYRHSTTHVCSYLLIPIDVRSFNLQVCGL